MSRLHPTKAIEDLEPEAFGSTPETVFVSQAPPFEMGYDPWTIPLDPHNAAAPRRITRRASRRRWLLSLAGAALAAACGIYWQILPGKPRWDSFVSMGGDQEDARTVQVPVAVRVLSEDRRRVAGAVLMLEGAEFGKTDSYGSWYGVRTLPEGRPVRFQAAKSGRLGQAEASVGVAGMKAEMRVTILLREPPKIPEKSARQLHADGEALEASPLAAAMPTSRERPDFKLLTSIDLFFSRGFNDRGMGRWATALKRRLAAALGAKGVTITTDALHRLTFRPLAGNTGKTPLILAEGLHPGGAGRPDGTNRLYSFLILAGGDIGPTVDSILKDIDYLVPKPGFALKEESGWTITRPLYWPALWSIPETALVRGKAVVGDAARRHLSLKRQPEGSAGGAQYSIDGDLQCCEGAACRNRTGDLCPVEVVGSMGSAAEGPRRQYLRYAGHSRRDMVYVSGRPALLSGNSLWAYHAREDQAINVTVVRDGSSVLHRQRIMPRSGRIAVLGVPRATLSKLAGKQRPGLQRR